MTHHVIWDHVPVAVSPLDASRLLKAGVIVDAVDGEPTPGHRFYEPTLLAMDTYRGPRDALEQLTARP